TNPANPEDFGGTLPTGSVTFNPGDTSRLITVYVTGDTTVEADETFTVKLSNPTNSAIITTTTAIGTIQNDDAHTSVILDMKGGVDDYFISSYDPQQDLNGQFTISDDQTQLNLLGNTWKKLDINNYTITKDTILEFEFQSTRGGEIYAIGFDTDNVVISPQTTFQLNATQNWGLGDFNNYTIGQGWKTHTITVGDYFRGDFNYLTFANDHDVLNPNGNGFFRNIQLYEASLTQLNNLQ
ncbi:Calx-beta domain-containing protein, partial [Umezakia ovalisporum]|nr:hypothetical protein [Umezakia ovalisporum APH033B]